MVVFFVLNAWMLGLPKHLGKFHTLNQFGTNTHHVLPLPNTYFWTKQCRICPPRCSGDETYSRIFPSIETPKNPSPQGFFRNFVQMRFEFWKVPFLGGKPLENFMMKEEGLIWFGVNFLKKILAAKRCGKMMRDWKRRTVHKNTHGGGGENRWFWWHVVLIQSDYSLGWPHCTNMGSCLQPPKNITEPEHGAFDAKKIHHS